MYSRNPTVGIATISDAFPTENVSTDLSFKFDDSQNGL